MMSDQSTTAPNYIKSLEGFRGVCIALVLLHNLFPYSLSTSGVAAGAVRALANLGWVGVQWFFVLSGFLITRILLNAQSGFGAIKIFYVRRCLRIFPVYYFTLLLLLVILPYLGWIYPGTKAALAHPIWFWTYTSNLVGLFGADDYGLSHFWSLAVEEQFYLVWPWLIVFVAPKRMKIVCLLLILSAVICRLLLAYFNPPHMESLAYVLTFVRWDALAIGALLAYASRESELMHKINKYLAIYIIFLFAWFMTVFILYTEFKAVGAGVVMLNQSIAALAGALIIFICMSDLRSPFIFIKPALESRFLCHLGKHSYAIYVFHLIVAIGMYSLRNTALASDFFNHSQVRVEIFITLSTLVIAYILSLLSWKFIESPLLSLKKHF